MIAAKQTKFIVLYRGCPVKFVHNHCGHVWSVCHRDDASQFDTEDECRQAILDAKIVISGDLTIKPA